ncbi:N-hydroxyarylamine O-acetyltransferase [Streptomyces albidoflavus]|nr:N-hydroxyarylamine O-acetyltransferase [Streptomyces albidoflavus]QLP94550.1 N-hydroxyarylamine O-acetyltransferase [Streptomyces albidoflavus]WAE12879.1 N-hydroxyarylamine O-acetyltransferase [Streptomyces albidoflavus]WAE18519.1 N-hydroxyarylamine O-acetyltransferase [Streptomyces albidoflavus]
MPELAGRHARVTAEVEVTGDARPVRQPGGTAGDESGRPPSLLVDGRIVGVAEASGTAVRTRTPVLLIVPVPDRADGDRWRGLLPSTRLRLTGRLAPPLDPGGPHAAVLRPARPGPPVVTGEPSRLQQIAGELRAGLRMASEGLEADARALLPALVVGDTGRVPDDLREAFRATDLTHLMAVSGSNLTIVLALLIGPPGRAHRAERGGLAPLLGLGLRTTAVAGGALTLAFVIVCRPEPSVVRAAACGAVTLLAVATGRRRSLVPALAAAVLLLSLWDPWLARGYGFLLSVLATGALLLLAPRWSEALRERGVPARIAEAVAAAAAAQAVCAPVVAVLSARVGLVAVPCNLVAEFAVAPATVLGFAALALAPVLPGAAELVARGAGLPAGWIAGVARTGAALPGAGFGWPGGWGGGALLALVTVVVVLAARRLLRGRRLVAVAVAVLLVLFVVQPPGVTRVVTGWPPPGWRMVLCDVGQGDALVLAAGPGAAVVVDTGPDPLAVDRCLRVLGISRVPLIVLTHFHADHTGGLAGVLRGRSVGLVETTALADPPAQAALVHRTAAGAGVPVRVASAGEARRADGGLSWEVLWPPAPSGPDARPFGPPDGANDASLTLLVRTAGLTLLLLGDLEPPGQRALARTGRVPAGVDVLKVAHHGSAHQDPGLLAAAAPRLAVVSVGADNGYGHPAPSTLAAFRDRGVPLHRTDRQGDIAVLGGDGDGDGGGAGRPGSRAIGGAPPLRVATRAGGAARTAAAGGGETVTVARDDSPAGGPPGSRAGATGAPSRLERLAHGQDHDRRLPPAARRRPPGPPGRRRPARAAPGPPAGGALREPLRPLRRGDPARRGQPRREDRRAPPRRLLLRTERGLRHPGGRSRLPRRLPPGQSAGPGGPPGHPLRPHDAADRGRGRRPVAGRRRFRGVPPPAARLRRAGRTAGRRRPLPDRGGGRRRPGGGAGRRGEVPVGGAAPGAGGLPGRFLVAPDLARLALPALTGVLPAHPRRVRPDHPQRAHPQGDRHRRGRGRARRRHPHPRTGLRRRGAGGVPDLVRHGVHHRAGGRPAAARGWLMP